MKKNNKLREFQSQCHECDFEGTVEEKRDYKGELLAIAVCPVCHFYDWMLPEGLDEEDEEAFDLTNEWAREESQKILKEHNLFYKIEFSEPAKQVLTELDLMDGVKKHIIELCDLFNVHYASVNRYRRGIKISLEVS